MKRKKGTAFFLNGVMLSLGSLTFRAVAVSFRLYLTSALGTAGMGLFSLIMTVYGFALTLATSGVRLAVTRLVAERLPHGERHDLSSVLRSALLYALSFGALASVLLFASSGVLSRTVLYNEAAVSSLRLLAFTLVPSAVTAVCDGYFSGTRKVTKSVLVQCVEQGTKIVSTVFFLSRFKPSDVAGGCFCVVGGDGVSEVVAALLALILCVTDRSPSERKTVVGYGKTHPHPIHTPVSAIASIALPVAFGAYARSALSTVEHLAIPWGLGRYGAGDALSSLGILHGSVFPLLLFPTSIPAAFSGLLIPELSEARSVGDVSRIRVTVHRVLSLTLWFAVGVSAVFLAFSREIGETLPSPAESSRYLRALSPLLMLSCLDVAVDSMLKGLGKQVSSMRINVADAVLSVGLTVVLLPGYGIDGYVLSAYLTEIFNASLSLLCLLSEVEVSVCVVPSVVCPILCAAAAADLTRTFLPLVPLPVRIVSASALYLLPAVFACRRAFRLPTKDNFLFFPKKG